MNKITTVISTNRKVVARKARFLAAVVLGIGIGILLNKDENEDLVIYKEENTDRNDLVRLEDLSESELKDVDGNTSS